MLEAYNQRIPFTVPAADSLDDQVVEDSMSLLELLLPKLVFFNTHATEPITLTIERVIDMGVSADPEDNGTIETTVVNAQVIAAGGSYAYTPDLQALMQAEEAPSIKHLVTLTNAAAEPVIVQLFVSGLHSSATRTNLFNFFRNEE